MSALPLIADIPDGELNVRFVPIADIPNIDREVRFTPICGHSSGRLARSYASVPALRRRLDLNHHFRFVEGGHHQKRCRAEYS
jgi:hypothetical protein